MIVELVERGGWDRSKPLRHMVDLLNKRLITDRISADTVAKAIDDLYSETKGWPIRSPEKEEQKSELINPVLANGSLMFRSAPKATELLRHRDMTRSCQEQTFDLMP